jgi:hypothetical protein
VLQSSDPGYFSNDYNESIRSLEDRLGDVQPFSGIDKTAELTSSMVATATTVELYKLAGLIYLERISKNFSGQSEKINSYTSRAFQFLDGMGTCYLAFPLLIFGCEARTDNHRMTILDLIERTTKEVRSSTLEGVRSLIQSVWIQDDLETENELNYVMKLNTVISSTSIIPIFA